MSDRTCSLDGCERPHYGREMCTGHYQQWLKGQELKPLRIKGDDDARFLRYTRALPNGCVEWIGTKSKLGYGHFRAGGRLHMAHRWWWERKHGPVDPSLDMDHYRFPEHGCIGPSCVLHVRPVTRRENVLRGESPAAWGAAQDSCPQGHAYAGENLGINKMTGGRFCRRCAKDSKRRSAARKAARKT